MIDIYRPEVDFALRAVRQAALLVKQVQAELVSPALTKEDRSPVTVADFASQALVGYLLERAFPRDPLVGEEDSSALRSSGGSDLERVTHYVGRQIPGAEPGAVCAWIDRGSAAPQGRYWTLDPIDGTKGFLRGDQYAVALALVIDGQVQVGVLGCPNLRDARTPDLSGPGSLVIAARGQGAWVAGLDSPRSFELLHVSECAAPAEARLMRSFEAGHTNVEKVDGLAAALGSHAAPVRMDSQAKYAVLAAGGGELMVRLLSPSQPDYREKIWDQAAGSLVLEEAGGKLTDLDGKPLDFTAGRTLARNRGVLASNGWLHASALQALQRLGA
jgi:3'(2'), 5'-bisphosphate nucleotidase